MTYKQNRLIPILFILLLFIDPNKILLKVFKYQMLKPIENSIIPLSIVSPSKTIDKSKIQRSNGGLNVNNTRTDAKSKIIKQIGTRQKSKQNSHNECLQIKLLDKSYEDIKPISLRKSDQMAKKQRSCCKNSDQIQRKETKVFTLSNNQQKRQQNNGLCKQKGEWFSGKSQQNSNICGKPSIGKQNKYGNKNDYKKSYNKFGKYSYSTSIQQKGVMTTNKANRSVQRLKKIRQQIPIQIQIRQTEEANKTQTNRQLILTKDQTIINNLQQPTYMYQKSSPSPYKAFKLSSKNTSYQQNISMLKKLSSQQKLRKYQYLDGLQHEQQQDIQIGNNSAHLKNKTRLPLVDTQGCEQVKAETLSYEKFRSTQIKSPCLQKNRSILNNELFQQQKRALNQTKNQIDSLNYHYYLDPDVVHKPQHQSSTQLIRNNCSNKSIQKYQKFHLNPIHSSSTANHCQGASKGTIASLSKDTSSGQMYRNRSRDRTTSKSIRNRSLQRSYDGLLSYEKIKQKQANPSFLHRQSKQQLKQYMYGHHRNGKFNYMDSYTSFNIQKQNKSLDTLKYRQKYVQSKQKSYRRQQDFEKRVQLSKDKQIARQLQKQRQRHQKQAQLNKLRQRQIQIQQERLNRKVLQIERKSREKQLRIEKSLQQRQQRMHNASTVPYKRQAKYSNYNYLNSLSPTKQCLQRNFQTPTQYEDRTKSREANFKYRSKQNPQKITNLNCNYNSYTQKLNQNYRSQHQSRRDLNVHQFALTDRENYVYSQKVSENNIVPTKFVRQEKNLCNCYHECECKSIANELNTSRLHRINSKLEQYIVKNIKNQYQGGNFATKNEMNNNKYY